MNYRGIISLGGLPNKKKEADALKELMKMPNIQKVASEDSASEVKTTGMKEPEKRQFVMTLDDIEFVSLQHRIKYGDMYRYGRKVTFGGPHPEIKDKIKKLLVQLSGSTDPKRHEYDAMELANCYSTDIDYFVTIDKRTVLKFKKEIERGFRIKVISPSDLLHVVRSMR